MKLTRRNRFALTVLAAAMLAVSLFVPVSALDVGMSEQEQALLDSQTEIVVGFYENTEPLAFVQSDNHYSGAYIEILEYLKKQAGLNLVPRPISRDKNWKELVASGEIDFYIGASNVIVSKDDDLRITEPFLEYANVLLTRNDCAFSSLQSPVIALTHARANWSNYLQNALSANAQFRYYQTARECMLAVVNGEADASLLNNLEFNYQSKNARLSSLILWPQYRYPTSVSLAASENVNEVMFSVMNRAISLLTDEYTDAVVDEWLSIPYHSYTMSDTIYNARYLLAIVVIVASAVCVFVIMLRRNHKKQEQLRQEAYTKERHQLQVLAATSFDYSTIYYIDLDDNLSEPVNQKAGLKETLGVTATPVRKYTDALKYFVNSYVKPEYHESILACLDRETVLDRFRTTPQFTIRYEILPDIRNETFFEMHFVQVAKNSEGHNMMVLAIRCIDDVVKAERAQQQILLDALDGANRASAAKSEFLSRMSHDIRTPMNAIIGMTTIAKTHLDDRERVADSLNKITASGHHLLGLINDVLDMSKIESGKARLTEEPINLLCLIDEIQSILRPNVEEHGHTLTVDTSGIRHARVIGDALRIRQACINLLGNAVKYTPDGGVIRFTIREKTVKPHHQSNCYEFIVQDNGIGMSPEIMEHIFDPFMRAEDAVTKNIQGTGLGLPITQNIARMMNGDIHVESQPGNGSTFAMTLFLQPQENQGGIGMENMQSDPEVFENIRLTGRRVLLVEDNELNREIAGEILSMAELTMEEAVNGKEALDKFIASEPGYYDLILMDLQMPVMDGLAAARAIRALDRPDAARIPIVAMTANAFAEDIQASKAAGMNEHLSKPINLSLLGRVLLKYLK